MVGSKDRVGSFELRGRTQDTVQGLISEAYIQQYFQEVFLQLFYEDPEFREQVLKCLLTGDNDEGTVQVSKPRRTWFNGRSGIQEVSREEARYLHICSENPSIDSDLSTEVGDERYHIAFQTKPAIHELPTKHLGELKADASLGPVAKDIPHSTVLGSKDSDMNQSGVPCGSNSKVNYLLRETGTVTSGSESLEDRPQGPIPSEVASDGQHKSLEESLTSPCVHERRIQTWKANPLFLLSNVDSDSNDSWQQESPSVAWMDDLGNGKMLQEVKMRKMKRLEESRPPRKAEGYDESRVHSKSEHEGYIQCNVQGLPHYPTEDSKILQLKGRKKLNEDQTENPSIGGFVRAIPSFIIVIPKQTSGTTVTSCPEKKLEECLVLGGNKITNLPIVREGRDPGPCLHKDDVGDLTSSSPSAETTAVHQNHILKPPQTVVPQELPIVFLQEDEKALFKQSSPQVSIPKHKLDGEVRLASDRISGAQDVVLYEIEKPKFSPESISPVETKVISEKGLNAPVSIIVSSAMLDETNRIEEERKSLAPVETKVISEKGLNAPISNDSSSAMLDEPNRMEEERKSLAPVETKAISEKGLNALISNDSTSAMLDETNRIEEERKSLAPVETKVISEKGLSAPISNISSSAMLDESNRIEEKSKSLASSYRKQLSKSGMKIVSMTEKTSLPPSCAIDDLGEEMCPSDSISESTKSLKEELHMSQRRIPTLVTASLASICEIVTGDETTEAPDRGRDILSEKEISSPLTPKSLRKSPLVAIAEVQVVDTPEPLAHNVSRPIVTRTPFRPAKDIHWQPPTRNIQFLGMKIKALPNTHWKMSRRLTPSGI